MENFTDLFGDDLAGLDGLGDLGNFGSSSDQMDSNTGASGGQSMEMMGAGGKIEEDLKYF